MSTTLTFNHRTVNWELSNPAWDRPATFLTHDAAMDYVSRNRIVIDEPTFKVGDMVLSAFDELCEVLWISDDSKHIELGRVLDGYTIGSDACLVKPIKGA